MIEYELPTADVGCLIAESPELGYRARAVMARHRLSPRTQKAYLRWMKKYYEFHDFKDPRLLGAPDIAKYLTYLAVERKVAASTQNQALCALLFLHRKVLAQDVGPMSNFVRSYRSRRLPTVLSKPEVRKILEQMQGTPKTMCSVMYGSGLRISECCQIRIKDLDVARNQLIVRQGKGDKDRVVMLPKLITHELIQKLEQTRIQHQADLSTGAGYVALPNALHRKSPQFARDWRWQWLFAASRTYLDDETGQTRRHHIHETVLQRAVTLATARAGITKRVSCHTFRHSFATHVLESGVDIRALQKLLGHKDIRTTMIYPHVAEKRARARSKAPWTPNPHIIQHE